jgi:type VI secretion system secreted protein Hcp
MAQDMFLKIADVKGETIDAKHKDEIEVLSYSWGVSNAGSMAYGTGGGEGKASFQDLSFTHKIDKASPVLMSGCALGVHYKDATLTLRKSGKGQQEFLIYKMNDVIVTSVQHGSSGDATTSESVSIAFAKVVMEYKAQKADGTLDAGVFFKYDIKAQKEG